MLDKWKNSPTWYDTLDRLIRETTPQGTISYAYDLLGRRTTMTVDGQSPVAYTYDTASRLRGITQAPLTPVTIDYDALGRRTLLTLPNGVSTEYQYDVVSRLTALIYRNAAGILGDLQYSYDPAGNRLGVGGSFARTLLPDPVLSSTYDAANQQLAFGDKTMAFDANGNLTSITDPTGTTNFTWDARNRLTALNGPTVSAGFQYDALGRRVQKVIGTTLATYQYDGLNITREILNGTEATYLRGLTIDEALTRNDGTSVLAYLADVLGSTVGLADLTGGLATTYTYEPFGRTTLSGLPSSSPFQFTGRENDGTADLYYYRMRYYQPGLMRFITEDPIRLDAGDLNFYSYVANRPTIFTDPLGLEKQQDCDFGKRFVNNFLQTNRVVLGSPLREGITLIPAAEFASVVESKTVIQFALSGLRPLVAGAAKFTLTESFVIVGATTLTNTAFAFAAFEIGVTTGSLLNAAVIQPLILQPLFGITGCE